ncbi:MAG: N-acetylmuramoyl-L-alanine amidase [Granulosicoccus sp.]|nr:N-acetylmuramoyl-L-alanine amidase [Granulosicoccus sp.]
MLEISDIRHLVVHCSDTPDDETIGARDIHAMHLGFGWHGVGYHQIIQRDGTNEAGRPEYWQGAHVYGFNEISLGVCLIGRHEFTPAQFDALEKQLRQWLRIYPQASVCGHRDFSYTEKTCPNFDVAAWCQSRGIVFSGALPA